MSARRKSAPVGRTLVRIDAENVTVIPRGLDRLWCFRRSVIIPLARIDAVGIEAAPHRVATGWRGPGLDFLGKLCGTFHPDGERHFWNYSGSGEALRIDVAPGQHFRRLYLSVADAEDSRRALAAALSARAEG